MTLRGVSTSVRFLTGHSRDGSEAQVGWVGGWGAVGAVLDLRLGSRWVCGLGAVLDVLDVRLGSGQQPRPSAWSRLQHRQGGGRGGDMAGRGGGTGVPG